MKEKKQETLLLDICLSFQQTTPNKNFGVYLHAKNQIRPSLLSWDIAKKLQICDFEQLEHTWPQPPKTTVSICKKL